METRLTLKGMCGSNRSLFLRVCELFDASLSMMPRAVFTYTAGCGAADPPLVPHYWLGRAWPQSKMGGLEIELSVATRAKRLLLGFLPSRFSGYAFASRHIGVAVPLRSEALADIGLKAPLISRFKLLTPVAVVR